MLLALLPAYKRSAQTLKNFTLGILIKKHGLLTSAIHELKVFYLSHNAFYFHFPAKPILQNLQFFLQNERFLENDFFIQNEIFLTEPNLQMG